jgi:hypothetical protein
LITFQEICEYITFSSLMKWLMERGLTWEVIIMMARMLNLDCHISEALIVLKLMFNLLQSLEWRVRSYVGAACVLARG